MRIAPQCRPPCRFFQLKKLGSGAVCSVRTCTLTRRAILLAQTRSPTSPGLRLRTRSAGTGEGKKTRFFCSPLPHSVRLSINAFGVRRPCRYRFAKSLSDALSLTRERVRVWVSSRFKYYASHRHRRTIASRRYAYDRLHPHPPRDMQEQITRRPLPVCACGPGPQARARLFFDTL